jgi:hypothetical protein
MWAHFRHMRSKIYLMTWGTPQSNGFWPLKSLSKNWVHWNSNSQSGSSLGSMRVRSLTLSYIPGSMRCDSRASFLARTLASPCLGREPKAKFTTTRMFGQFLQRKTLNMWHKGASFYMPNSISTWSLKDLNISLNLICPKLFNFHTWSNNYMVYTRIKKIDTVVPKWILFYQRGRFTFHLQEPKIFSPSICVILIMQINFGEYFRIVFTSCFKSLDWVVLHKSNSILLGLWFGQPPCLKWEYNVDCLKIQT